MGKKATIAWFVWGALCVGWMMWHDFHQPNCLALYGAHVTPASQVTPESVSAFLNQSDKFLDCSENNQAGVFFAQAIGIGALVSPLLLYGIGFLLWEGCLWCSRKVLRAVR